MNRLAREEIEMLLSRQVSNLEYRKKLTRMKNMGIIFHRSGEITENTLRYFNVNDMYLGSGDYFVIMLDENESENSESGEALYDQIYIYALLDLVAEETLTGHYTFYSCELDGRLAVLICFPDCLPDELSCSLRSFIYEECRKICARCKDKYDIQLTAYVSEQIHGVKSISEAYHKLLGYVTFQHYVGMKCPEPVVLLDRPKPSPGSVSPPHYTLLARELANAITEKQNLREHIDDLMRKLAGDHIGSVDMFKRNFRLFFEHVISELQTRGILSGGDEFRAALFQLMSESISLDDISLWLYETAENLSSSYKRRGRTSRFRKMSNANTFIIDNLHDSTLSAALVAEAVGLKASSLSTMFKKQFHIPVWRYIQLRRLETALELLKTTSLTIREVCERSGFGSIETFHRVFKNEYGISPGKLKRIKLAAE